MPIILRWHMRTHQHLLTFFTMPNILRWHMRAHQYLPPTFLFSCFFSILIKSCTVPFIENHLFHYYFGLVQLRNRKWRVGLGRYQKISRQASGRQVWFEGRKMLRPNLYFWAVLVKAILIRAVLPALQGNLFHYYFGIVQILRSLYARLVKGKCDFWDKWQSY